MTEEHYQDGIKLPTDKDIPKWEEVFHIEGVEALERMKLEYGYLYRNTILRTNYHVSMVFVPDNKPSSNDLLNKVAELSMELNKMQDSLREFEKGKVDVVAKSLKCIFERIQKLEEHHTRQIDENRKVSHILDNLDRFSNSLDERIEKLENSLEEADLKNLYDTTFSINGNYAHKNLVAHHYIEITKRLEKLETFAANPHAFDITTKYVFPNKPEKPECQHEWDTNLLLSNPPKIQCKKCKFTKTFGSYFMTAEFNHPRDEVKLCAHGMPILNGKIHCTACY